MTARSTAPTTMRVHAYARTAAQAEENVLGRGFILAGVETVSTGHTVGLLYEFAVEIECQPLAAGASASSAA